MQQNRLLTALAWELKNLFRFPFPEALLAMFVYITFVPHVGGFSFSVPLEYLDWLEINRQLAYHTIVEAARLSSEAYLPMGIFASIFITLSFAYEIENGLLKIYLSHPIGKKGIFLSKFLSCFLIIYTTFSTSFLTYALLKIPENTPYFILSMDLILRLLFLTALESFFVVSLITSFSIFSEKASVSLIGSFAIIYTLQLLNESLKCPYLPPTSFTEQALMLFSSTFPQFYDILNFALTPIASTFLIVISYIYFSRRLEMA
jgi:ABC-type transport system involved in multi-copper enzyme maturation permease subunit